MKALRTAVLVTLSSFGAATLVGVAVLWATTGLRGFVYVGLYAMGRGWI